MPVLNMKYVFLVLSLIFTLHVPRAEAKSPVESDGVVFKLIENKSRPEAGLPYNFRASPGTHVSGSAQPSEQDLLYLAKTLYLHQTVILVDLRLETHVFLDGKPFSEQSDFNQKNWGLKQSEIFQLENDNASILTSAGTALVSRVDKKSRGREKKSNKIANWTFTETLIKFHEALTEQATLEKINQELKNSEIDTRYQYIRLANPDHLRPRDENVDRLVELVNQRPDAIFHFHCKAGKGRTTTAMAMVDLMKNYATSNLSSVMERQFILGGFNLKAKNSEASKEREKFLQNFYQYCREEGPQGFTVKWSEWIENHPGAGASVFK